MGPIETRVWPIEFYENFKKFLDDEIGTDYEANIEYSDAEDKNAISFQFVIFDCIPSEYQKIVRYEDEKILNLLSFEDIFNLESFIKAYAKIKYFELNYSLETSDYEKHQHQKRFDTYVQVKEHLNEIKTNYEKSHTLTLSGKPVLNFKVEIKFVANMEDFHIQKSYPDFIIDCQTHTISDIL